MSKKRPHHHQPHKKLNKKEKFEMAVREFPQREFNEYWKKHYRDLSLVIFDSFMDALATRRLYINTRSAFGYTQKQELHGATIARYCETLPEKINGTVIRDILPNITNIIYNEILGCDNMVVAEFAAKYDEKITTRVVMDYLRQTKKNKSIIGFIRDSLTELMVYEQILLNPHYEHAAQRIKGSMMAKQLLLENIQTSTPNDYTKLFPLARKMKRHFIIHIGPTNSGKTFQAMEELRNAKSGIYLAPLRLLAYEQYEKMNREGCPCSMITGEEQIFEAGSFHQSSTIEMLNLEDEWDMAVIDEAQMVSDEQRGGSWTSAILGIRCPVIHLCASADAEKLLIKMVVSCRDSYEVVYHNRMTPLEMDESARDFRFPENVEKGDALIVFSRRDVHSVAAELQAAGRTCSIIYGSLPYDVRHREAGKFANRETDVVVATDAIGMGMNLPIRRIVFLQTIKFDGVKERPLTSSEVKQIAGRAGRYGLYDTGLVTSYYDYWLIENLINQKVVPIRKAMIGIPSEFLEKDGKVSTILELWNQLPAANFYDKGDISEKIKVAKALEAISDNRELIRQFIRIPVNADSKEIFDTFLGFYRDMVEERPVDLEDIMDSYSCSFIDPDNKSALQILEMSSQMFDMLYSFTRLFGNEEDLTKIIRIKRNISDKIFVILDKQKLSLRTCPHCGKKLKWSYKFNVCQECFRKGKTALPKFLRQET